MKDNPILPHHRASYPKLTESNYAVTSESTVTYNCICWAYGRDDVWMWPNSIDAYWPEETEDNDDIRAIISIFRHQGYTECENGELEEGYEKVAVYTNENQPTHATRQLLSGKWTSKLGGLEDIEHDSLEVLENGLYGKATTFLKKKL